jgi:hypothetical protein
VPIPAEAKLYLPGLALTRSASSLAFVTGSDEAKVKI